MGDPISRRRLQEIGEALPARDARPRPAPERVKSHADRRKYQIEAAFRRKGVRIDPLLALKLDESGVLPKGWVRRTRESIEKLFAPAPPSKSYLPDDLHGRLPSVEQIMASPRPRGPAQHLPPKYAPSKPPPEGPPARAPAGIGAHAPGTTPGAVAATRRSPADRAQSVPFAPPDLGEPFRPYTLRDVYRGGPVMTGSRGGDYTNPKGYLRDPVTGTRLGKVSAREAMAFVDHLNRSRLAEYRYGQAGGDTGNTMQNWATRKAFREAMLGKDISDDLWPHVDPNKVNSIISTARAARGEQEEDASAAALRRQYLRLLGASGMENMQPAEMNSYIAALERQNATNLKNLQGGAQFGLETDLFGAGSPLGQLELWRKSLPQVMEMVAAGVLSPQGMQELQRNIMTTSWAEAQQRSQRAQREMEKQQDWYEKQIGEAVRYSDKAQRQMYDVLEDSREKVGTLLGEGFGVFSSTGKELGNIDPLAALMGDGGGQLDIAKKQELRVVATSAAQSITQAWPELKRGLYTLAIAEGQTDASGRIDPNFYVDKLMEQAGDAVLAEMATEHARLKNPRALDEHSASGSDVPFAEWYFEEYPGEAGDASRIAARQRVRGFSPDEVFNILGRRESMADEESAVQYIAALQAMGRIMQDSLQILQEGANDFTRSMIEDPRYTSAVLDRQGDGGASARRPAGK